MSSEHTATTVKMSTVRPRTLVVAGNAHQFANWRSEDYQARRDTQYVSEAYHVRGYAGGTTLHFVGTYWERNDLHGIMEYAVSHDYNITFGKSA